MHEPIPEQGRWLGQVVRGYFAYHAVPTNSRRLGAFRYHVVRLWRRTLRRRSQKDHDVGAHDTIGSGLPADPRILHPWPTTALPSNTQGGSPVRESRPLGFVRGALSNECPYRDVPKIWWLHGPPIKPKKIGIS